MLTLEDPSNRIEIVVHVNMLKEGWDVTNLYTIIPLRTAASTTLREQTLGRGLRLPYGKRTGSPKVDKLTIIAADEVRRKACAAAKYCADASDYTARNSGKPWRYLLIPHDAVRANMSLEGLAEKFAVRTKW